MSIDVRRTAVGTTLLLASSGLFLTTGVDGRISALLAGTAALAACLAAAHFLGAADGRTA